MCKEENGFPGDGSTFSASGIENPHVVIVVDRKTEILLELATKLKNMLGASKKCEVAIWGLKEYKDNEPTLTSSQRIIFLGKNDISRLNISSINWKYKWKNHLYYGWIGRIAMLYASEQSYTKTEIKEFKEMLKKQNVEIRKLPEGSSSGDTSSSILGVIALIVLPWWIKISLLIWAGNEVSSESKNLLMAQYSYLVNEFMLNGIDGYLKE
jgi:hypothetical protein